MRAQCFVICPFGESGGRVRQWSDFLVENIIKPAAGDDYDVGRTLDVPKGGDITARIHRELASADIVVADLSEGNSNVAYELGIRHALKKPYVLVCRKDSHLPFDLRNMATVFADASYDDARNQYLMAAPAKVAAELRAQIDEAINRSTIDDEAPHCFRARAFDWNTTYSSTLALDWLRKQERDVQEAAQAVDQHGAPSADAMRDHDLVIKLAEYAELRRAANQKYKGQLFYFLNPVNTVDAGFAVYKFPTGTSTIDATGREDAGKGADITFDQPSRDVHLAGMKVTLPPYEYSVRFRRRTPGGVLAGELSHPATGTLLGRAELTPKWGLGL